MKKKHWIILSVSLSILGAVANFSNGANIEVVGASSYLDEIPKQLLQEQIEQYYEENEVMLITAYIGLDKMDELGVSNGDPIELEGSIYRAEYSPLVERNQVALKVQEGKGYTLKVIQE